MRPRAQVGLPGPERTPWRAPWRDAFRTRTGFPAARAGSEEQTACDLKGPSPGLSAASATQPSPSPCTTSRPGTEARVWREVVQITPINYGASSCDDPAETPAAPACPNRTVCSELLTASSREPARGRVSRSSLAASLAGLRLREK